MSFADIVRVAAAVIASFGGAGAILFALSNYFGKIWADRALEKQRQEHAKLNLEFTHQLELVTELAKHSLQMAQFEHQVRFSKLHEKRAEVIAEIYDRALHIEHDGERYVSMSTRPRDHELDRVFKKLDQDLVDFYKFVERHSIYLPEQTCTLLTKLVVTIKKHVGLVELWGDIGPDPFPEDVKDRRETVMAAVEAFHKDIPEVKKALEAEFRKMLGVESSQFQTNSPRA